MSYGISPDFLIVRADTDIPEDMMDKIARASGLVRQQVISAPTLDSIYRVPLAFHKEQFGEKITKSLGFGEKTPDMTKWENFLANIDASQEVLRI
jgi:CTP synthase